VIVARPAIWPPIGNLSGLTYNERMYQRQATLFVIGFLIVMALAGWGIVVAVQNAVRGPAEVSQNVATRVQELFNPTPTVYPDPVTVILQVRSLARLETAQYTIEKVITAETGQGSLAALFGDKLIFVAHGEVIAGVDLSKVSGADVTVSPDGQVTLILPAAEVFVATLDNDKSYVYDRDTGLFTKGDVNLETMARQVAQDEIQNAALEDGILKLADENAAVFMERFLRTLRFTGVNIITATPMPPAP
jgi:uncharacterized protein DUF4230